MVNRVEANKNFFDTINDEGPDVLTTSWSQIVAANSSRMAMVFTNIDTSNSIYLSLNGTNIHMIIGPGQTMIWKPDGIWQGVIHAKSSAGTPSLYFAEFAE